MCVLAIEVLTCLRANDSPSSATIRALAKLVVEPVLLATTHHRASGIVRDLVDVVGIPVPILGQHIRKT